MAVSAIATSMWGSRMRSDDGLNGIEIKSRLHAYFVGVVSLDQCVA
jgi:hypothetical protein